MQRPKKRSVGIIFLSALLFICSIKCDAQPIPHPGVSHTDKRIIEKYLDSLSRSFVIDGLDKKDINNRALIDSLMGESKSSYNEGLVFYSPDKKFKIFVFTGESCGGNCTYINTACIHIAGGGKLEETDLFPVEKIFKLDDGKYLIIQKGLTDGGIYLSDLRAATLLSIKNGKIIYHHILYSDPQKRVQTLVEQSNKSLQLKQNQTIIETNDRYVNKFILRFDPQTKELNYSYAINNDFPDGHNGFQISGYFHYENGAFVHKKEKRTPIKLTF